MNDFLYSFICFFRSMSLKLDAAAATMLQLQKYYYSKSIQNNTSWKSQNIINSNRFHILEQKRLIIYIYSISYNLVREATSKLDVDFEITKEIRQASLIIGLKNHLQQNQKLRKLAREKNIPIYKVSKNSVYQIVKLIQLIML